MSKDMKFFLFALYFCIISLIICFILMYFTESGLKTAQAIFAPKHYISFDKLEKVTIAYNSNGFGGSETENVTTFEIEVTDKDFLDLIEQTYRNKIINDYLHFDGGVLTKGIYKIQINDNIEICPSFENQLFCIDCNGKWIKSKFNEEIYNKMMEIIKPELERIKDIK